MSETPEKSLAAVPLFENLGELERKRYESVCSWRSYQEGQEIIGRESDSKDVFFVASGKVRVVNYSFSGREISYEDIAGGQLFGELAAIDGRPRSASVVAMEDSLLAIMPGGAFLKIVTHHPPVAHAMMQRLAEIVRTSTDRIMDLSTVGAHNRVYAEILRLARPSLEEDNTAVIQPIPVHADIASRVSTTRESVARAISELLKKDLVAREDDALIIRDFQQLEDTVHEFRNY
ncbi:MAG: Crp/Fnr family transcriptional regulator [Thermoanaerobaculia bacterium]|nr:Crp/Fnr family transcriptional regulator [Thermoanaerobaculia bacterium]